jgi:DNA-binding MarR family transcriptional regulator
MTIAVRTKSRQAAPSLSKQRLRLWIRILRAARAIEAEVRDRLRVEFGVTLPQFDVMAALERKPDGMTMTELSRFLMVSNGNVRLTPRGLKGFTIMAKAHQGWVDGLLSDFDAVEADTLIRHLDGLSGRIRNGGSRA